ncbi:SDR family NAD(P)-dependent oxidoreductase [Microbacterium sp. F51-2R]|uniref:SDR family NAD(P)-dependent oxidoreductase n=1 Tax=Microbacterium sp. F51-2R TaxID=3445777 RepID=UPI003F9F8354
MSVPGRPPLALPSQHAEPIGTLGGRTAVVVGAGQEGGDIAVGNGRATAVMFARYGANVVLVDRNVDAAAETLRLVESVGGQGIVVEADVTCESSRAEVVERAVAAFGRIDILHNNVGSGHGDEHADAVTPATWQRLLDLNLTWVLQMCRLVVPLMRDAGSGIIINVSSLASLMGPTSMATYTIAKSGINTLTRLLAADNAGYNIRVNALAPGVIDTPHGVDVRAQAQGIDRQELSRRRSATVPLGRSGSAWDVAAASVFLASDAASFLTGLVLPIDGGMANPFNGDL